MGLTSAAEAKLDARIRPDITMMRATTPYPKRRLAVVGEAGTGQAGNADAAATAQPGSGQPGSGQHGSGQHGSGQHGSGQHGSGQHGSGRVSSGRPGARAGSPGPIRLTRRGRIVVGGLVVAGMVAVAALIWLLVAGQARAASSAAPVRVANAALRRVVVRPGQTLWSIAVHADPAADPRVVVREIVAENGLGGTSIQAGQVLWVPRG